MPHQLIGERRFLFGCDTHFCKCFLWDTLPLSFLKERGSCCQIYVGTIYKGYSPFATLVCIPVCQIVSPGGSVEKNHLQAFQNNLYNTVRFAPCSSFRLGVSFINKLINYYLVTIKKGGNMTYTNGIKTRLPDGRKAVLYRVGDDQIFGQIIGYRENNGEPLVFGRVGLERSGGWKREENPVRRN